MLERRVFSVVTKTFIFCCEHARFFASTLSGWKDGAVRRRRVAVGLAGDAALRRRRGRTDSGGRVGAACNSRTEKFQQNLARFRQNLQVNMRFKALAEICTMHFFALL